MADIPRDPASLRKAGEIAPELAEALRTRPFPEMPAAVMAHRRARAAHLAKLRYLMPVPGPIPDQVSESRHFVPSSQDGYKIPLVLYTPKPAPSSPGPLVVLYHEGGWRMGDLTDEEFNARILCRDLGVSVLNVDYRLIPEHPFPTGVLDCWDVLKYAVQHAVELRADPSKGLIVGGSSAGGNIAAILSRLSRNEGLQPPVTGQWLSVPYLIPSMHVPDRYQAEYLSPHENVSDPIMGSLNDRSFGARVELEHPLFSVVASELYPPAEQDHQHGKAPMARALIQVAGLDPLRDHGLVYDRILREEFGTQTRVHVYPGYGHMFWTNWPEMEASKQFTRDMLEGFKWLIG